MKYDPRILKAALGLMIQISVCSPFHEKNALRPPVLPPWQAWTMFIVRGWNYRRGATIGLRPCSYETQCVEAKKNGSRYSGIKPISFW
jgi:hypothetical protein